MSDMFVNIFFTYLVQKVTKMFQHMVWFINKNKVHELFHAFHNSMKIMLFKTHALKLKQPQGKNPWL